MVSQVKVKKIVLAKVRGKTWNRALERAGFDGKDKSTNRHTCHLHTLRKFFSTRMKDAGVPEDVVEAFVGHEEGLDGAYRRYSDEQLVEQYKRGEPSLYVNVPKDIKEIQQGYQKTKDEQQRKIDDVYQKLTDVNTIALKFSNERTELSETVDALTKRNTELGAKVNALEMRFEHFSRAMDLTPEDTDTLSEIIGGS